MKKLISIIVLFVYMMIAVIAEARHVHLEWTPPTKNIDGSELTNLDGYMICYGPLTNQYQNIIDIGSTNRVTLYRLKDGETYCVRIAAYNEFDCLSKWAKKKFIINQ